MHGETWHSAKTVRVDAPTHTWAIFNVEQFRRVVELFVEKLKQINRVHPFNAIAGCGNSGVPLAAALSYTLGIPLITVRKPGEETVASTQTVTGAALAGAYVIIDDFTSSGGTVNRMMDAIDAASCGLSTPVAMAFYSRTCYGEMGADQVKWRAKNRQIPVWGVTSAERSFIEEGGPLPGASSDQLDLFDWAEANERRRKRIELAQARKLEEEKEEKETACCERSYDYNAASVAMRSYSTVIKRLAYEQFYTNVGEVYQKQIQPNKKSSYIAPPWIMDGSVRRMMKILPRNAR